MMKTTRTTTRVAMLRRNQLAAARAIVVNAEPKAGGWMAFIVGQKGDLLHRATRAQALRDARAFVADWRWDDLLGQWVAPCVAPPILAGVDAPGHTGDEDEDLVEAALAAYKATLASDATDDAFRAWVRAAEALSEDEKIALNALISTGDL